MIDDAALELVALSEFSRSDHEEEEEEEEVGSRVGMKKRVMVSGMEEIFVFLALTSGIGG